MQLNKAKPARYTRVPSLVPRVSAQPARMPMSALTATQRITGRKLQGIRRRYFEQQPLCITCKKHGRTVAATEIDHIRPLWDGGADDSSNRQGLCDDCHAQKTAAESYLRSMMR